MMDVVVVGALYFLSGACFVSGLHRGAEGKVGLFWLGAGGVTLGLYFGTVKLLALLS